MFVQAAMATGLPVSIAREDGPAGDARSLLSVMGLGVESGDTVVLTAEGDGAESKLDELVALLESDLDAT
ncbi:HPr family phosphocarrier protein [Allosalinactinospora lopnorensis]|uniref:HPr family phosphocarrier protein n=1 Tax=Allosalinactinospora lopnorensis TaxID=1352348 RepID=UPI001F486949|nr:HPr family phosphocarrier protein [Allosalinactinospora lopnorensis]